MLRGLFGIGEGIKQKNPPNEFSGGFYYIIRDIGLNSPVHPERHPYQVRQNRDSLSR
jgi:hypothetical protein